MKVVGIDKRRGGIAGFDFHSRRLAKFRRWIWVGVGLLIVLVLSGWLLHDKFLTIKHIVVVQQVQVMPNVVSLPAIRQALANRQGQWLWINTTDLSDHLERQFPSLSSVEVISQFPDTLEVDVLPRVPLCQLITPGGVFLVDRQGFIFAKLDKVADKLLQLKVGTQPQIGKSLSTNGLELGLQLITTFRSKSPGLRQIDLHDGQLDVQFDGPLLVMIADTQKPAVVVPQLQALLQDFATTGKKPVQIDMRYDRPVLRY